MSVLDDFIRASDRVVEFQAYFETLPVDSHSLHTLEVQKDEIVRLWSDFRSRYDEILNKFNELEEDVEVATLKSRFFSTFEAHVRVLAKSNEILDSLCRSNSSPAPTNPATVPPVENTPHISLPPCDTEVFHGDYQSWPTFRDMFTALYRNSTRLSPVEKMCHLIKKTQGEARELLKTCPITNEGFEMAWRNLVNRYENKRILINAQLKILFNISPVAKETSSNIRRIQRTINDCVTNLSLLKIDTENWDIIFVYICSTCLPENTLSLWEQSLPNSTELPTWKQMDVFLTSRFQTLESVADIRTTFANPNTSNPNKYHNSKKLNFPDKKKVNSYNTSVSSEKTIKCSICSDSHPLRLCPSFLAMNVDERYAIVKNQKRCSNCLGTSHEWKKCRSQYVCHLCKRKHHSLLHRSENTNPQASTRAVTRSQNPNPSNTPVNNPPITSNLNVNPSTSAAAAAQIRQTYSTQIQSTSNSTVLLGTALVDIYSNDLKYTVRALIDSASEATFISKKLQNRLLLKTRSSQTEVHGLNGALTATSTQLCYIRIGSPIDDTFETFTDAFVVKKLTGQLPYFPSLALNDSEFSDLRRADPHIPNFSEIELLLGGDIYPKIIRNGLRWDSTQSLVAQQTVFGWIITGRISNQTNISMVSSFYNEIALNHQLQKFWEIEEVPKRPRLSAEDAYCENIYQSTTYRNSSGRFVVSLPFRQEYPDDINIGPSRHIALSQFLRNEFRLMKNPPLKSEYDRVISEYSTLGQMTMVSPSNSNSTYYLPHHAVLKPDSTTTKLRVVFNASSPSSNGNSLNDLLYPGPILQADLTILILRWRLFRYVYNSDIEKMYRQILVNPSHTPFQRIIFRNSPQDEPQDFELNTVTFGVNCAPYLAIRTLLELAKSCEQSNPAVSNILRNYMYVDDVLAGAHTLSTALKDRDELIDVLQSAGFSLRKWTANHDYLLKGLSPDHLLDTEFLKLSDSCKTKTLGLRWNAGTDKFYFQLKNNPDRNSVTKRSVLSEIAKLFDPAGWFSPKIIVAKIIMQQIWKDETNWDEELKPSTLQQWHDFLDDYVNIGNIQIPRFVDFDPSYSTELHGFCDASEKAYAATLYLRAENFGYVSSHLLVAKTKVAPVKFVSLPRKELCGAELMATMIESIQSQLDLKNLKLFLWTDSTIVLAWLQKPPNRWKTFVENRVSSIIEKVGSQSWSHVDSKNNPADLATRGLTVSQLASNDLWWHGPSWLSCPRNQWPTNSSSFTTEEEAKPIQVHLNLIENTDILNHFSDLTKAMRVICRIFRFYYRCNSNQRHKLATTDELTRAELENAKTRMIIASQRLYFENEYNLLSQSQEIPRKSSLLTFNPFLDSTGIMRINGRLANSPSLNYDERYPILLPYHARYTRLFLSYLHKYSLHGQNALLYRLMRLYYYVPKLKTLIKTIISQCRTCVIQKRQKSQQIMAALPPERTTLSRPFTNTGVDFAGPFDIKTYAGRGCKVTKGYVLVFVCFATKAIHLEATSDISTQAFLAAFARFFSRRGCPNSLYSDNGTAFVGASNILDVDKTQFVTLVRRKLLELHDFTPLQWHFIPPGAPHMGGLWEAGVKSFKMHLKRVSHSQNFTFEEFSTLLARIESCLNSRPLSPSSENHTDLCALTPGHFLIGSPLLSPPEPNLTDHSLSYVSRWQKLKVLHHHFAQRWKEEYLKELHKRFKWKYPQRDYAIGDLVVIRQDNLPPNQWRLGRIENVVRGSDNRVRVAEVRTANGIVTRPIVKLILLPNPNEQH
ncbi:uncharacterized protein LOC135955751 [Calliphora vicina]|uniref:uncharacterized protein LOC135955751 n=1 Tax=Calliphora vicina TaxID=7373 RepID=UPI00325A6E96